MVVAGTSQDVVFELGVVALTAAAFAIVARRIHQPTVVGFLVGGLLAGPVLGLVQGGRALETLGELGIALLLFLVGIDLSIKEVRAVGVPALLAAAGQLTGSALGGYAIARMLGFDTGTALFLAIALAFSSTVVVVKILIDLGDLGRTYGRLAVGIFLVQDVVVVLLLTILPVVGPGTGLDEAPQLMRGGGIALAQMALLAAGAAVASRTVLPIVFSYAAGHASLLLLTGLVWLFAAVAVSNLLAVSVEVGAFIAGLSLAPLPYASELRRRVRPLLDLFLALFFVTLAAGVALGPALRLLPAALAFSAFVLLGKAVVLTAILVAMGYPRETSLRTGITIGQVSEFSIVLAALALSQGLIDENARNFVLLVAMITIAVSGGLIWRSQRIHDLLMRIRWFRALPEGKRSVESLEEAPRDHVLMLGWDSLAERTASALVRRGERVVVLDVHADLAAALPEGVEAVYGDPDDVYAVEAAGLDDAKAVVLNGRDADLVRIVLERARADVPVIARADDADTALALGATRASVVAPAALIADELVRALREARPDG